MENDVHYMSYFSVFAKHKVRIIVGTLIAFFLMFIWCTLGIPPMQKKWRSSVGIIYPLQKSSLAIKRTLGSLDIPLGGLGGILGGSASAYNNIPVMKSRRVLLRVIDSVPGVREKLDKGGTLDDGRLVKKFNKFVKIDDSMDGFLLVSVYWGDPDIALRIILSLKCNPPWRN